MSRTIDKRIIRTKEAIMNAFEEMICERKPELINVKTLSERAGIHRKTFYLHYTCIEALFEDALNSLAQQYSREVEKLSIPYTYYDLTRILFEFYTKSEYNECLFCNPRYTEFAARLSAVNLRQNRQAYNPYSQYSMQMQNIINAFVTQASCVAFRQWVADGKVIPMEEAVQMVGTLLERGVEAIRSEQPS